MSYIAAEICHHIKQLSFLKLTLTTVFIDVKSVSDTTKTFVSRTLLAEFSVLNSLPDDKILDWSKFKQIVDDILKYI